MATAFSALTVVLAIVAVAGAVLSMALCKTRAAKSVALCASLICSLLVPVSVLAVLGANAACGDWRAIEDTIGPWTASACIFALMSGAVLIAACGKALRK